MSQSDDAAARRSERLENAAYHARAAERRRAQETERARAMVVDFAREAASLDLPTQPLTARSWKGTTRYRTGLVGWYLRPDRSLGVTPDGSYYALLAPPSLRSRLTGVVLEPADPPLQVGAGGRDGDSVALDVLLRMRLDAGPDGP